MSNPLHNSSTDVHSGPALFTPSSSTATHRDSVSNPPRVPPKDVNSERAQPPSSNLADGDPVSNRSAHPIPAQVSSPSPTISADSDSESHEVVLRQVVRTPSPPLPFSPVKRPFSSIDASDDRPRKAGTEDSELYVAEQRLKKADSGGKDFDEEALRAVKRRNVSSDSKPVSHHSHASSHDQRAVLATPNTGPDERTSPPTLGSKNAEKPPSSLPAASSGKPMHTSSTSSITDDEEVSNCRIPQPVRPPLAPPSVHRHPKPTSSTVSYVQEPPLSLPAASSVRDSHSSFTSSNMSHDLETTPRPIRERPPSLPAALGGHRYPSPASFNITYRDDGGSRGIQKHPQSPPAAASVHRHPKPTSSAVSYVQEPPSLPAASSVRHSHPSFTSSNISHDLETTPRPIWDHQSSPAAVSRVPRHISPTLFNISYSDESHPRRIQQEQPPPLRVASNVQHHHSSPTSFNIPHGDESISRHMDCASPGAFDSLRRSLEPKPASTVERPAWVPLKRAVNRRSATPGTFSREDTPRRDILASSRDITSPRESPAMTSIIKNRPESSTSRIVCDVQEMQRSMHKRPPMDFSSEVEFDPYPYSSRLSSPEISRMHCDEAGASWAEELSTPPARPSVPPPVRPQSQVPRQSTPLQAAADRFYEPPSSSPFRSSGSQNERSLFAPPRSSLPPSPPYFSNSIRGSPPPSCHTRTASVHPSRQLANSAQHPSQRSQGWHNEFNDQQSQSRASSQAPPYLDPDYVRGSQGPSSSSRPVSSQPGPPNDNDTLSLLLRVVQRMDARLADVESAVRPNSNNPAAARSDEEVDPYQADSEEEPMNKRTRGANTRGSRRARTSQSTTTANRKRSQDENDYNATIRQLMRELLTPIEYREDGVVVVDEENDEVAIPIHSPPSDEELLQFAEGKIPGPTFEDFSIAWLPPGLGRTGPVTRLRQAAHKWNDEAAYVFATTFMERLEAEHYSPASDDWKNKWKGREELEKRFLSKLQNYNATYAEQHYHTTTVAEEDRLLYLEKDATRLKKVHANSRRKSLFAMREQTIAYSKRISKEQRQQYL